MPCEVCGEIYVWNQNENIDAKPHVCKTCGLSFSLKIQLKRHGEVHADGQPYVCINCTTNPAQGESKYNLRLSKKIDDYPCEVCGESFISKRILLRHSIKEHCLDNSDDYHDSDSDEDYEEPKKKRQYNFTRKPKGLGKKKKSEAPLERKQRFCPNCCKGFVYQSSYEKHINEGKCSEQKIAKRTPKANKKLKKVEDFDSVKHECSICGKNFTRKSSLDGHMVLHAQDSDDGPDEKDFDDSNADISDDYVSEPEKPKTSKIKIRKSYTCDQCNFVCFSKPTFDKHSRNHLKEEIISEVNTANDVSMSTLDIHKEEKPSEAKAKETFLCEICDKVFLTKGRLKKHLLFHVTEGEEEDMIPPKLVTPKSSYKRHKNFRCDVCGKQFAGLTCLNKHVLKHNSEEPSYPKTKKCKTSFSETCPNESSKPSLKTKEIKTTECEFCHEQIVGKRSVYMKHLHSHTPEVCGICDERFVDRASLREHCKVHIGTEEGRKFMECSQKALEAKLGVSPPEPKVEYIYLVLR